MMQVEGLAEGKLVGVGENGGGARGKKRRAGSDSDGRIKKL